MIRFDSNQRHVRLSVGDLVHYGDEPPLRQIPALGMRLAAGSREHREWQRATEVSTVDGDFVSELPLEYETSVQGVRVTVDGRLDGLRRDGVAMIVEEVKTVLITDDAWSEDPLRTSVQEGTAYHAYRFQLEVYVLMVDAAPQDTLLPTPSPEFSAETTEGVSTRGRLVFRNLACEDDSQREIAVEIEVEIESIRQHVHERLERIVDDILSKDERRSQATDLASRLPFPFPTYRTHQQEISEAVLDTLENGESLLLTAPPGLGKTAAVLHATLLFALPRGLKVFWLTAKTTQQRLVAATVRLMVDRFSSEGNADPASMPSALRAVVLRARDKMCPNLEEGGRVFCHDAYCRYARDHWRKVRRHHVLEDLLELPVIEPDAVYERSVRAEACPYEVSLAGAASADLIIGDYNYVFDPSSHLKRLDLDRIAGEAILVIDEAHNLLSRGRESHSPALERRVFENLFDCARNDATETEEIHRTTGHFLEKLGEIAATAELGPSAHEARVDMPNDFLDEFAADIERWRTRRLVERGAAPVHLPDALDDALDACSKASRRFLSTLDLDEGHLSFVPLVERRDTERLRLLCLDPSELLSRRLGAFRAAIALSATLSPIEFFRDMLGFAPETTRMLSFPTPFPRENRGIFVDPSFATTYRKRSGDAARIAKTVDGLARERPGNYLVFLSSHQYQREVVGHVDASRIGADVLVQKRFMSEAERDDILDLLREPGSDRILFAVQGGIFSEGVDYPGDMATGVIVVGPGLPRFDHEQELIREHFDQRYDKGFEYAYLYPGMHRVIQAAGRLIRTPDDVGIIVLLGERFADSRYSKLLPSNWYESTPSELVTSDLIGDVRAFWKKRPQ